MNKVTRGAEMFDAVRAVFSGALDVRFAPEQSVDGDGKEKVIGTLVSPIAKVFYSEAQVIGAQMRDVLRTHEASHGTGKAVDPATCDVAEAKLKELKTLQDLHVRLFWEGVYSQFPRAGFGIRDGWKVVALGSDQEPAFGPESPALMFFEDVHGAFLATDSTVFPADPDIAPVNEKDEEFILGQVTMPALKALFFLKIELNRALNKVAQEFLAPSSMSPVEVLRGISTKCARLKEQIDFVDHLFWLGVEKSYPAVAGDYNFALRRGWNIVRIPKDSGSNPYMLMTLDVLRRSLRQED